MEKTAQKKAKGKAASTIKDLKPKSDAKVKGGTTTVKGSKSNSSF